MKTKILLIWCSLMGMAAVAQNPVVWMPDLYSFSNTTVDMPVIIQNLDSVYAISLGITCGPGGTIDTAFTMNMMLAGTPNHALCGDEMKFIWFYISPFSTTFDTLCTIKIHYTTGNVPVNFVLRHSELGNVMGKPMTTTFTHGSINLIVGTPPPLSQEISVYPNPATDHATLRIKHSGSSRMECAVFDMYGRKVQDISLSDPKEGMVSVAMSLGGISPGTYLVRLKTDHAVSAARLIKME